MQELGAALAALIVWGLLIGIPVGIYLIRRRQKQVDEARRQAQREVYEREQIERAREEILDDLDHYFPFLQEPFRAGIDAGKRPEEAFWEAIDDLPAVRLGTTFYDLPALLPLDERRKHLYVVGKTGSGKTTLLLNLIKDDLEAGRGICVIAPEAELFRDWLLPLVPEERAEEVIYFAPGTSVDTSNPAKDGQLKTGQSSQRSSGMSCSASVGREQVAISGIPR